MSIKRRGSLVIGRDIGFGGGKDQGKAEIMQYEVAGVGKAASWIDEAGWGSRGKDLDFFWRWRASRSRKNNPRF